MADLPRPSCTGRIPSLPVLLDHSSPPMLSLRLVGVCLSGCGARTAAFLHATGGGAIRHHVAPPSYPTGVYRTVTPPSPQVHHAATKPYCSGASHGGGRSLSSSLDSVAISKGEVMGQDSGEMFDVFLPPVALCALSEPPRPAGFSKARGLVHADGDWHRSVHIWLHSSEASCWLGWGYGIRPGLNVVWVCRLGVLDRIGA